MIWDLLQNLVLGTDPKLALLDLWHPCGPFKQAVHMQQAISSCLLLGRWTERALDFFVLKIVVCLFVCCCCCCCCCCESILNGLQAKRLCSAPATSSWALTIRSAELWHGIYKPLVQLWRPSQPLFCCCCCCCCTWRSTTPGWTSLIGRRRKVCCCCCCDSIEPLGMMMMMMIHCACSMYNKVSSTPRD